MRRRITAVIILLVFCVVAVCGCGTDGKGADKKLRVVAAYGNKEQIFKAFTADTGIKVDFLDMSSGEVLARAAAEGGKPMADVWFGGGIDSFLEAKGRGLLVQYNSPEAAAIPEKYRDSEGYWYGVSLVMAGIMVNTDLLKKKGLVAPQSWQSLADKRYRGELLFAMPGVSGTSFAFVSGMLTALGNERGWVYLQSLAENVPYFSRRGGDPPAKVAAGEAAVGVVPMSGEFTALKTRAPIYAYFPQGGVPWTPSGLAIFRNAANIENARKFVDWALSERGQKVICAADPRIMTRTGMPVPELYRAVRAEDMIAVNLTEIFRQRQDILKEWDEKISKK